LGFGGMIGVLIGTSITTWAFNLSKNEKLTPSFEFVGNYKNCKIVKFSTTPTSNYDYFLDCPTPKN
jgi:hypothetical protein